MAGSLGEANMKSREVILRAIAKKITWDQAADVLGISYSAMWRLRALYQRRGYDGHWVRAIRKPPRQHVPLATVEEILLLYQEKYSHLTMRCFHKTLHDRHGIDLSYEWVSQVLHEAGLVAEQPARHSKAS